MSWSKRTRSASQWHSSRWFVLMFAPSMYTELRRRNDAAAAKLTRRGNTGWLGADDGDWAVKKLAGRHYCNKGGEGYCRAGIVVQLYRGRAAGGALPGPRGRGGPSRACAPLHAKISHLISFGYTECCLSGFLEGGFFKQMKLSLCLITKHNLESVKDLSGCHMWHVLETVSQCTCLHCHPSQVGKKTCE